MKITIQRSGGFAGLREMVLEADTQKISAASAAKIQKIWPALQTRIRAQAKAPSVGADFLKYEIIARQDGGEDRFELLDDGNAVTPDLLEFVRAVSENKT